MQLLKFLRALFHAGTPENGNPSLGITYRHLLRLADQILAHAEKAPYPHVAERLRHIALEKQKGANLLKDKLGSGAEKYSEPPLQAKSGKNHWERMVMDLEDQKALETELLQQATVLSAHAPGTSNLLLKIAAEQAAHKETLLDFVARADPQAELS